MRAASERTGPKCPKYATQFGEFAPCKKIGSEPTMQNPHPGRRNPIQDVTLAFRVPGLLRFNSRLRRLCRRDSDASALGIFRFLRLSLF